MAQPPIPVVALFDANQVELSKIKRYSKKPNFRMIQIATKHIVDSRSIFKNLSQKEAWFFWTMDELKEDSTNEVSFSRENCPKESITYYTQVISSLITKTAIIRVKPNYYLMNPNILIPFNKNSPEQECYTEVLTKWKNLGGK